MGRKITKKPELHLLKLGKGSDADAENLAKLFEALTGKRPSQEEIDKTAKRIRDSKRPAVDVPPKP